MVIKLTAIKDPSLAANDRIHIINKRMALRDLVFKQLKNNKYGDMTVKSIPPVMKKFFSEMPSIMSEDFKIEVQPICERVLEKIQQYDNNNYFCIGKDGNRMFCGSVIQRIPPGGFASISNGRCIYFEEPPLNQDDKFEYEKDRQLAVKVYKNVGEDFLVVVARNGCLLIEAGAYAAFDMPVFVVEESGEYYKLEEGQRFFPLRYGHNMLIYTYEAPILFLRVVLRPKRKPMTAFPALQRFLEITKESEEQKSIEEIPKKKKKKKKRKKDRSISSNVEISKDETTIFTPLRERKSLPDFPSPQKFLDMRLGEQNEIEKTPKKKKRKKDRSVSSNVETTIFTPLRERKSLPPFPSPQKFLDMRLEPKNIEERPKKEKRRKEEPEEDQSEKIVPKRKHKKRRHKKKKRPKREPLALADLQKFLEMKLEVQKNIEETPKKEELKKEEPEEEEPKQEIFEMQSPKKEKLKEEETEKDESEKIVPKTMEIKWQPSKKVRPKRKPMPAPPQFQKLLDMKLEVQKNIEETPKIEELKMEEPEEEEPKQEIFEKKSPKKGKRKRKRKKKRNWFSLGKWKSPKEDTLKEEMPVGSIQEVAPANGQGNRTNERVIVLVAVVAIGLLLIYLLSGGSHNR